MAVFKEIENANVLILGASQGIGFGFVARVLQLERSSKIYATYR